MLRGYYRLTKPGIVYGNTMYLLAGFALASIIARSFNGWLLVATVAGTALVVGSGCVFNNYTDRRIDHHMARTKKRALVTGAISPVNALIFGAVLGAAGFAALVLWTNWTVVAIGAIGFVDYVFLYGYTKRKSMHGTLVGSISGAMPPVAGYCAVTGHFDTAALLLFLILAAWQMPHFYAIAMYRRDDYAKAGLPVMPVAKGMHYTKVQILIYVVLFIGASLLLTIFGYTGMVYFGAMVLLGGLWLRMALQGFGAADDAAWARKMFGFSLIVTLAISVLWPLGAWLP